MLTAGTLAPEVSLPDHEGRLQQLTQLLVDGPLILYFYPADFTPGCTREACDLRDLHQDIVQSGLRVVGVSPQSPDSHRRFRDKYSLPFLLLSDERKEATRAYDVDGPFGIGVRRATFLIGRDGIIQDALLADLRINRHREFVARAVDSAAARR